ncbi:MAG: phosphatase PAP2 family protein [Anaerolineales bacterium]
MLENLLNYDAQIAITLFLQSLGQWLTVPMQFLSFLGNEEFYLLVMPALYWCFSPALGLRAALLLMLSNSFNAAFKYLFALPRPYWYSADVQAFSSETSFGLPSGHSQNAAALWGMFALRTRQKPLKIGLWLLVALIGISRIYLGVHFSTDVLFGWLLGALLLWLTVRLEPVLLRFLAARKLEERLLTAFAASLVMILIGVVGIAAAHNTPHAQSVLLLAAPHLTEGESPFNPETPFTVAGAFFGLAFGALVLQARQIELDARGNARALIFRYLLGVIGILLLWRGLGAFLPDDGTLLALGLRYIRYTLIGAWISAGAPLLFLRLGWMNQNPSPSPLP